MSAVNSHCCSPMQQPQCCTNLRACTYRRELCARTVSQGLASTGTVALALLMKSTTGTPNLHGPVLTALYLLQLLQLSVHLRAPSRLGHLSVLCVSSLLAAAGLPWLARSCACLLSTLVLSVGCPADDDPEGCLTLFLPRS